MISAFRKRGVTMMELVIMIAIASVLFTGLTRVIQNQIRNSNLNRNYLIALNLAKIEMAKLNIGAFPAVDGAETALTADAAYPSFIPTRFVTSVAVSGSNNLRLITVRVRLLSVTGSVLVRLDTYRTDLVSFGDGV